MTPLEQAARECASQILGECPEDIHADDTIIVGFMAGAEWQKKQECDTESNTGPTSGLPCDFDINNPDRVVPLNQ